MAILDKSSDLFWVVSFFLFFLILFHVLFIGLFPLTKTGWKRIEYVWVSMAFVSCLGLIDEARRYQAANQFELSGEQLGSWLRRIDNWVDNYHEFSCIEQQNKDLCLQIRRLKNDVSILKDLDDTAPELTPLLLESLVRQDSELSSNEKMLASDYFTQYQQERQRYLSARQGLEKSPLNQWLIMLAPLLLSAALALKFTTISGELSLMKKE